MSERKETCCNFCGKPESLVDSMLSAGDVHICNECVCYCYEMLYGPTPQSRAKSGRKKSKSSAKQIQLKKPADMKKILDEYVIGQDAAKISLSVAVALVAARSASVDARSRWLLKLPSRAEILTSKADASRSSDTSLSPNRAWSSL